MQRDEKRLQYQVFAVNGAMQRSPGRYVTTRTGEDTVPFELTSTKALTREDTTEYYLRFSKPVDTEVAEIAGNYQLDPSASTRSVQVDTGRRMVRLTTDRIDTGRSLRLHVRLLRDLAKEPNTLETHQRVQWLKEGQGVACDIYATDEMSQLMARRSGGNIEFDWKDRPAAPGVSRDSFAIRIHGSLRANRSGSHRFLVRSENAVRLKINGQVLIDTFVTTINTK